MMKFVPIVAELLVVSMVLQVAADEHYITPTVSLVSCLFRQVVLEIFDCQEGGVMYITHGTEAYNIQFPENGTVTYSCHFNECDLGYNTAFTFVVQRNVGIQSVHDVKTRFTCLLDQSDITPKNMAHNKEEFDKNTQFVLISARASMKFYDGDRQLASGTYIKLGTHIRMVIELRNTFDASGIQLVVDRCPVDEDLFDTFNKTSVGAVQNKFQMFRTTSSNPEPAGMLFSCLVEVCYAPCVKYKCNGTVAIPETNRRKRSQEEKEGTVAKSMKVGSLFRVGLGDPVFVNKENTDSCVEIDVYFPSIALLGFFQLLSTSALTYYWREKIIIEKSVKSKTANELQRNTQPFKDIVGEKTVVNIESKDTETACDLQRHKEDVGEKSTTKEKVNVTETADDS
ncbi:uncharacterized protein LOC123552473 isoform X2 [Mercenaria mercenaria]|uniref:uncharacterized protein LOC123552473 isoform X2 n=1 Tax=Mercenaria mercenaria TaxID=6596 RepID=UPI00234F9E86|nr:uncharacterized protein LOC123552473 isoform X2 [Mercenaria mercenaria]